MDQAQFEEQLKQDGYQEISTRVMEPRPANDERTHDCTVRGLVTQGQFIVSCGDDVRSYTAGDVFEVAAGVRHNEAVGPDGATVTVGRLYSSS